MKKQPAFRYLSICILVMGTLCLSAQSVSINEDGSPPNASSILDIKSATKGVLIPRMTTTQRTSMTVGISQLGMIVYDTDENGFMFYTGTSWEFVGEGASFWEENGTNGLSPKDDKSVIINSGTSTAISLRNNQSTSNATLKVLNETGTGAIFASGTTSISGYPSTPAAITGRGHNGGYGLFATAYDSGTGILAQSQGSGPALDAWAFGSGLAGLFRSGDVEMQQDAAVLGNLGVGGSTASYAKLNVISPDRLRAGYFYNTFTSTETTYGLFAGAYGTGAGEKRGGSFDAYGGTGNNTAVRAFASDGASNIALHAIAQNGSTNWAGHFDSGDVIIDDELGIGTTNPTAKLHVEGSPATFSTVISAKTNYSGNSDVRAVTGYSVTNPGWGYGGEFTGGFRGIAATAAGGDYTGQVRGVYASATGTDGTRIGIYGDASGGTINWAGYFGSGNVYITNDLRIGSGASGGATGYKVAIDGKMIIEEVRVQNSSVWPDYVFNDDYKLPSIREVASHIRKNKHLPGIPSAREIETDGHHLGTMQVKMIEKIEELTLYIIQLNEELSAVKKELEGIKNRDSAQSWQ